MEDREKMNETPETATETIADVSAEVSPTALITDVPAKALSAESVAAEALATESTAEPVVTDAEELAIPAPAQTAREFATSPTTGVVHPAGYAPYAQAPQRPVSAAQDAPYTQTSPYGQPTPYGQPYAGPASYGQQPYTQVSSGQQPYGGPSLYSQFAQAQYGAPEAAVKSKKEKKGETGTGLFGIGRRNAAALVVVIVIACVVSGIGGGLIGVNVYRSGAATTGAVSGGVPGVTINPSGDITTTEAVAKKVTSSVVGITATGSYTSENFFFGPSESEVTGVGTGMIIDAKGYILTNAHVVMDGSVKTITVLLSNGSEVEGSVIWSDSSLDLAIVKIASDGLVPVELGDSDEVLLGSYVAAIGNPLGLEFSGSITQGVISGLNRTIQVSDGMGGSQMTMQGLIQVDAAINSGNSGGPLLNSKGQVIGVNTAKASAEGMGFAIPINTAIPIVEKVIKDGRFERVYMGVSAADVGVIRDNYPNVELFVDEGACITDVSPGSPAEKGGLKVKDVITAIDGNKVNGSDSLIKMLLGYESGAMIDVTYDRDGQAQDTKVTLLSQTELEKVQQEENPFKEPQRGNDGR